MKKNQNAFIIFSKIYTTHSFISRGEFHPDKTLEHFNRGNAFQKYVFSLRKENKSTLVKMQKDDNRLTKCHVGVAGLPFNLKIVKNKWHSFY
jgi:hypothetical protein